MSERADDEGIVELSSDAPGTNGPSSDAPAGMVALSTATPSAAAAVTLVPELERVPNDMDSPADAI